VIAPDARRMQAKRKVMHRSSARAGHTHEAAKLRFVGCRIAQTRAQCARFRRRFDD
jgi:predicted nucleic acid-binding Zn ribbon protein